MTTKKAIEVLKHYNAWRRGFEDELRYTPKEISEAIELDREYVESIKTVGDHFTDKFK